eukprot:6183844-Pleurochrysis_carterae.AAC.1
MVVVKCSRNGHTRAPLIARIMTKYMMPAHARKMKKDNRLIRSFPSIYDALYAPRIVQAASDALKEWRIWASAPLSAAPASIASRRES